MIDLPAAPDFNRRDFKRYLMRRLDITAREADVAMYAAQGMTPKQYARELGIACKTATNHRSRLFTRIRVHNAESVVALVYRAWIEFQAQRDAA